MYPGLAKHLKTSKKKIKKQTKLWETWGNVRIPGIFLRLISFALKSPPHSGTSFGNGWHVFPEQYTKIVHGAGRVFLPFAATQRRNSPPRRSIRNSRPTCGVSVRLSHSCPFWSLSKLWDCRVATLKFRVRGSTADRQAQEPSLATGAPTNPDRWVLGSDGMGARKPLCKMGLHATIRQWFQQMRLPNPGRFESEASARRQWICSHTAKPEAVPRWTCSNWC